MKTCKDCEFLIKVQNSKPVCWIDLANGNLRKIPNKNETPEWCFKKSKPSMDMEINEAIEKIPDMGRDSQVLWDEDDGYQD